MSRITIHNYEAFMLDMAEGTIADNDHSELMLFLAAHPELDVDLDGIAYATLEADGIHFPDKEILKKTPADTTRFDELAVKQLEETLTADEEKELQKLITANAGLAIQLKAFSQTKLQPDYTITFEGKEALKHNAVVKPLYYVVAAAASVVLLVGAFILLNNQPASQTGLQAYKNNELTISISPTANAIAPAKTQNTTAVVVYQPKKIIAPQPITTIAPVVAAPEKQLLVAINTTTAKTIAIDDALQNETAQAVVIPMPYIEIPKNRTDLLGGLWASAKGLLKKSVKDDEISARIDTVGARGFNWSDLAFLGSKGIEKITGKKNSIGASSKSDGSSSAFNIGRYTIVTNRKNKQ